MRKGNQAHTIGQRRNRNSNAPAVIRATTVNRRAPNRAANPGNKGAANNTPNACIAALMPMNKLEWPRAMRLMAIKGAERLYVSPNVVAAATTAATDNERFQRDSTTAEDGVDACMRLLTPASP